MNSLYQYRTTLRGGNFPLTFILTFALVALGLMGASKAKAGDYTKQNARVKRIQAETTYNGAGTATAVKMDTFLVIRLVKDSDSNDVKGDNELIQVSFDLLDPAISGEAISVPGVTGLTYQRLAVAIRQAALDRANAAGVQ
jgi:hypothetical protein